MSGFGEKRTFDASLTEVSGVTAAQLRLCYTGPRAEYQAENHAKRDVVEDDTGNNAKGKPTTCELLIH